MSDKDEARLLELGRELSRRMEANTDRQTEETLFEARQHALREAAPRSRHAVENGGGWLSVAAGTAVFGIVAIMLLWNGSELPSNINKHNTQLTTALANQGNPWDEDPAMLKDMDFALWLDMTGPDDAS